MAGEDVTAEITFKRWVINTREDMFECCADVLDLGAPFHASVSGQWTPLQIKKDPETGEVVETIEPQQVWRLGLGDGVTRGDEALFGKVVIKQGSLLMVMTPEEAATRGYGAS